MLAWKPASRRDDPPRITQTQLCNAGGDYVMPKGEGNCRLCIGHGSMRAPTAVEGSSAYLPSGLRTPIQASRTC